MTGSTDVSGIFHAIGSGLDTFLWFSGRTVQVVVVLVILGVLVVFRQVIISAVVDGAHDLCRRRNLRNTCFYYVSCQCCPFGAKLVKSIGLDQLVQAPKTLAITFVAVSNITKTMNIFFKAHSEPHEAASLSTRTISVIKGSGDVVSGHDKLELDWYGDEDEVMVKLLEFRKGESNRFLGEVGISGKQILKLVNESIANPSSINEGSRMFTIKSYVPKEESNPVKDMIVNQLRGPLGVDEELGRLQEENEQMRQLLSQTSSSSPSQLSTLTSQKEQKKQKDILSVVLRFELYHKETSHVDVGLFHKSSFHE